VLAISNADAKVVQVFKSKPSDAGLDHNIFEGVDDCSANENGVISKNNDCENSTNNEGANAVVPTEEDLNEQKRKSVNHLNRENELGEYNWRKKKLNNVTRPSHSQAGYHSSVSRFYNWKPVKLI
jgi:hypothetical protein